MRRLRGGKAAACVAARFAEIGLEPFGDGAPASRTWRTAHLDHLGVRTGAPVAIEGIVANINIDMPFLGHPIADVEGFGAEHATLQHSLARAAEEAGLVLTPAPRPELVRLIRSDQARQGRLNEVHRSGTRRNGRADQAAR